MKHSNYLLFLIITLFFSCTTETIQLKEIGIIPTNERQRHRHHDGRKISGSPGSSRALCRSSRGGTE